jgi:hypothetical protein
VAPWHSRRLFGPLKSVEFEASRVKRKPVPPAPTAERSAERPESEGHHAAALARVDVIRDAAPLVPKPEDDCCRRLVERADVPDRGTASAWLVFLSALGLVADDGSGYARTQDDYERSALADRFLANVFLAQRVVDALDADTDRLPEDVFEQVRDRIPRWERSKRDNWESFWTDRVERRLDWAVVLGLAERTQDGYRRVER